MLSLEAKQFKTFRKHLDLSQKDMAKALEVMQSEISKYENGTRNIPIEVIKYLHARYKMSYNWFFHREGPMRDPEPPKKTLVTDIANLIDDNIILKEKINKLEKDVRYLASKITNS